MFILKLIKVFFLLLPLLEIAGFVIVGRVLGLGMTLLLTLLSTFFGVWLLRKGSFAEIKKLQEQMANQTNHSSQALNVAMTFLAGIFMVIPGFITDIFGLILLVPWFRNAVTKWFEAKSVPVKKESAANKIKSDVIEGEYTDRSDAKIKTKK